MYYYSVLVADYRYQSSAYLTYGSDKSIERNTVVKVPLKNRTALGIIIKKAPEPPSHVNVRQVIDTVAEKPLPGWVMSMIDWIASYYPSSRSQAAQLLIPHSITKAKRKSAPAHDSSSTPIPKAIDPPLTTDQKNAVKAIRQTDNTSALLHGVTGSGKTRVYIELVMGALLKGESCIILTPEIGLTPQLEIDVKNYFGDRVIISHSRLSPKKRRDIWMKVFYSTEPFVIIGPRSALFYPLEKIGLIVVDEAHDSSYKQEQMPHYHASRVAATLAKLHNCKLVLGTATPSVVDYFTFEAKKLPIITMSSGAISDNKTTLENTLVDTSDRSQFIKSAWLADGLISSINQALKNQQQAIIYLNRRGTARVVTCQSCSWHAACEKCDAGLVYHGDKHILMCHTCGATTTPPSKCANCGKNDITYRSAGTKFIVDEAQKLFPGARITRFDSDSLQAESLQEKYKDLHAGTYDIIVGTQILAKGLDLPRLAVLGVLQADNALLLPDFAAEEELFQEIYQLLGRIGRGHTSGKAFIQTGQPNHPVIQAAIKRDYATFYKSELTQRKKYGYPPYCYLLTITADRASRASAKSTLEKQKDALLSQFPGITIDGPAPAFKEQVSNAYRWKLLVRSSRRSTLVELTEKLPATIRYDIEPVRIL